MLQQVRAPRTLSAAHSTQLCVEARFGRYDAARTIGERAVHLCAMTGADRTAFVVSGNLMECALEKGDIDAAIESGRNPASRLRGTSHSDVLAFVLGLMGGALTERGDLDEALAAARQAVQLLRDEGMLFWSVRSSGAARRPCRAGLGRGQDHRLSRPALSRRRSAARTHR